LRPYHNTLGPAAGPACSKILAPPLVERGLDFDHKEMKSYASARFQKNREFKIKSWTTGGYK